MRFSVVTCEVLAVKTRPSFTPKDIDTMRNLMAVEAPGLEKVPAKVGGVSETLLLKTDENSARGISLIFLAFLFCALLF